MTIGRRPVGLVSPSCLFTSSGEYTPAVALDEEGPSEEFLTRTHVRSLRVTSDKKPRDYAMTREEWLEQEERPDQRMTNIPPFRWGPEDVEDAEGHPGDQGMSLGTDTSNATETALQD